MPGVTLSEWIRSKARFRCCFDANGRYGRAGHELDPLIAEDLDIKLKPGEHSRFGIPGRA